MTQRWPPSEYDQQVAARRRGRLSGLTSFLDEGRAPTARPVPVLEAAPPPPPPPPVASADASRLRTLLNRLRGR